MPLILYAATTNPGKLRDFHEIVRSYGSGVVILPLPGLKDIPPPPEDAATFAENARGKAAAYSLHAPGCIVLADDSGLEVDALQGAPGVRSARYADDANYRAQPGSGLTIDERNNLFLLENLRTVRAPLRTARYRCAVSAACDGEYIGIGEGTVEGAILEAPRGSGGFGYDPLFYLSDIYLPDISGSMAEVSLEQKQEISHRGKALRSLLQAILEEEDTQKSS